jgi:hypothetical protein
MQFNLTRFFPEFRIAASGMAWKGAESEGVTAMAAGDIKWAQWVRVARNFQLRIGMKDHRREKFDGFMREVHRLADDCNRCLSEEKVCRIMTNSPAFSRTTLESL